MVILVYQGKVKDTKIFQDRIGSSFSVLIVMNHGIYMYSMSGTTASSGLSRYPYAVIMNIANNIEPKIKNIRINEDELIADLQDGRTISVPLAWSWRLTGATENQRMYYKIIGDGIGVHWPDVDEDISVEGIIIDGIPSQESQSSLKKWLQKRHSNE